MLSMSSSRSSATRSRQWLEKNWNEFSCTFFWNYSRAGAFGFWDRFWRFCRGELGSHDRFGVLWSDFLVFGFGFWGAIFWKPDFENRFLAKGFSEPDFNSPTSIFERFLQKLAPKSPQIVNFFSKSNFNSHEVTY